MNSFGAKSNLRVGDREFDYFSLEKAEQAGAGPVSKLPFSLKVMLENLLRLRGRRDRERRRHPSSRRSQQLHAVAGKEIAFRPARVLMQDFTGVPGNRRLGDHA